MLMRERQGGGGQVGVCAEPEACVPLEAQLSPTVVITWRGKASIASSSRSANESRNLYFYVKSPIFKC